MKYHIMYNSLAGKGRAEAFLSKIPLPEGCETVYTDITSVSDYKEYIGNTQADDAIVICGGDGTLNRFINSVGNIDFDNKLFFYGMGSGNDFLNDLNIKNQTELLDLKPYIKNLPSLIIGGKAYRFINGIGYGLDGYCCSEVNRLRKKGRKGNYTLIALKGLLYAYTPTKATVTVDGREYTYNKVWLTPAMKGRFFGGGMMITPNQDREDPSNRVTVLIAHSLSKLKITTLFPTIFRGNHIKYKKYIDVFKGNTIEVKFDHPTALQIDGETITDVEAYTVTSKAPEMAATNDI